MQIAMQGTGGNQSALKMSTQNARGGAPDLGRPRAAMLTDKELMTRQHFVQPSNDGNIDAAQDRRGLIPAASEAPGEKEGRTCCGVYDYAR